jgi:hypothetical protein
VDRTVDALMDLTGPEKGFSLETGILGGAVLGQLFCEPIEDERTIFGVAMVEVSLDLVPHAADGRRQEVKVSLGHRHGHLSRRARFANRR